MNHIFLSPHLDDAVLSAGNHIIQLIQNHKPVHVITIFSKFGYGSTTWDAKKYMLRSGSLHTSAFEKKRIEEDVCAMNMLGTHYTHLPYIDGGFRKDVKNNHLYNSHAALFSGVLHPGDRALTQTIQNHIRSLIKPKDVVYAPIGIGTHADHLIINQIARTLPNMTYFWLDQPYAGISSKHEHLAEYKESFRVLHEAFVDNVLAAYTSQIKQLYPSGITRTDNVFYTKA